MEISYFDNVKDSVKENESSGGEGFDTLREAAEETSENEQDGDDTKIEILEEGISSTSPGKTQKEKKREKSVTEQVSPDESSSGSISGNDSAVEDKLDTIIEQNERMIEILESFVN